jgi:hypothetical protein
VVVILVGVAIVGWSFTATAVLVIAGVTASATGIAWQRERVARGGEEARRSRERRGVIAVIGGRVRRQRARGRRVKDTRFVIGVASTGKPATVPFGSMQGVRGLIVGAPGTGKTVTKAAIASAYIDAGLPVVCVDPKGDPTLREQLAESATRAEAKLWEWSPEGPSIYNPLSRGDATEIADKALAGEEWTEPHYLRQAQRYLGWELRVLNEAGVPASLGSVSAYLDPGALEALGDRCDPTTSESLGKYLDALSSRQRGELVGVRDRLAILAESRLGRWLDPGEETGIDLAAVWLERAVLYLRLDADRYPLASQMLGAAIVSDLVSLTGELQRERALGLVAIDEFAAIGARNILRVLSRSRSAGVSVLLATQGLADLYDVDSGRAGSDGFARRVLSQLDFVVAHRQPEAESAETLAAMAGTRAAWGMTERVQAQWSGTARERDGTRRRVREFVRHPDEFKGLAVGEAIVIEPGAKEAANRLRVWPSGP